MIGLLGDDFYRWLNLISMAASIGLARYYGFTFMFPLFSWMEVRGPLRFAIAAALSMPSILMVFQLLRETGMPTPLMWTALVAKEAFVGALLGGFVGLPFWGVQAIGDTVDLYRGSSAANLFDPVHAQEMSISGKFLVMFALAIFVLLGGIAETVDLVIRSQAAWPVMSLTPPFEMASLAAFGAVAAKAMTVAMVLGAPLLLALLLVDVALVFAVRGARSFNVYDLTNSARGLMLLIILPVYAMLFTHHFEQHLRDLLRAMSAAISGLAR